MITLWGQNNSTNIKKVLLTLKELELPYEQILTGHEFGINHNADFLAMNPNRLVPLLHDNKSDLILWESNTIVHYLAAQYRQKHLWINSPAHHAEAEKWMDWANQTLSNAHHRILMGLVRTPPKEHNQATIDASCKECNTLFALLNAELAKVKWFSGNKFGVGNITITPFIYNLFNIGLTWTPRPNLQHWYQQLTEHPTVHKVVMIPIS